MLVTPHDGVAEHLIEGDRCGIVDINVQTHVVSAVPSATLLSGPHQRTTDTLPLDPRVDVKAVEPRVRRVTAVGPSNAFRADDTAGQDTYQHGLLATLGSA